MSPHARAIWRVRGQDSGDACPERTCIREDESTFQRKCIQAGVVGDASVGGLRDDAAAGGAIACTLGACAE